MSRHRTRRWISTAAAALLLGGLAVPTPAAAATDADDRVYGSAIVTDATGAPLEEAYIVLEPVEAGGEQVVAATDADGVATFSDAPAEPTAYRVRIRWDGVGQGGTWYRLADGFAAGTGTRLPTLVSSAVDGERLDAQVPIVLGTGSIAGNVLTALGTPVPGARVTVRRVGGVGDSDGAGFATSDSQGHFTVPHVTAGTFEVWADCTCGGPDAPFGSIPSPRVVVTIEDGQAVAGIDVRLGAKGRLSGSLLTEADDGTRTTLADPTRAVVVYPKDQPPTRQYASFVVLFAPDGAWHRDLAPGEYQVVFGRYLTPVDGTQKVFVPDQYHAGIASPSSATVVTVEPAIETSGIDAIYPDAPPSTVGPVQRSIVVTDHDGTPVPGAVTVVTSIASGESFRSGTDPSGYSSFHAAPYLPTLAELRIEYRQDTWVYTAAGFVPETPAAAPVPVWIQAGGGQGVIRDRLPFPEPRSASLTTPTVSGSAIVGSSLTVAATSATPGVTLEYEWFADGSSLSDAAGPSLELRPTHVGKAITARVTATAPDYAPVTKESEPTGAVIAGTLTTSPPTIEGLAFTDSMLSANPGAWTSGTSFAFQWFASGVAIDGATGSELRLSSAQAGKTITVRVTGTKLGYTTASTTSAPTSKVLSASFDRDFSGDEKADVLVRTSSGALLMYAGNGASGWSGVSTIGSGWSGMNLVFSAGDFSGDGYADVMARDGSGRLYLYRGNGRGGWLGSSAVGIGWGGMNTVFSPGDFSGDGYSDVLARDGAGNLWLYAGDGNGHFASSTKIGSGWNGFDQIFAVGDFTGSGGADVMGRTPNGQLFVYPSSGSGGWLTPSLVGTGWSMFDAVFGAGDFNGDGDDDVMGRDRSGRLWLYPGNGRSGWGSPSVVGTGWGPLTFVK